MTLVLNNVAKRDDGAMWPIAFARIDLTDAEVARIATIVDTAIAGAPDHESTSRLAAERSNGTTTPNPNITMAEPTPSDLIDARIHQLGDWRGETLARVRALIREADPEVEETWKWRGVPVWEHAGIICTGETYKRAVKLTFAKGAMLPDPDALFNSSLEGNVRRAIDITESAELDADAFKSLVRAAVDLNKSKRR